MSFTREQIKAALSLPLPGEQSHRKAMSYNRLRADQARREANPKESAVMALLFPKADQMHMVFIVRSGGGGVHSGQVAFPGGARDKQDADLLQTAFRELWEETGVSNESLEVLGELSEVYIPPSNFVVKPFVAYVGEEPIFIPSPTEVQQILTEPLTNLLHPEAVQLRQTFLPKYNITMDVPSFDVQGHQLWGATAMMVMEFREVLGA